MARILLTGATGYIASHTWLALAAAGFDVVGVDNFSNSSPLVLDRLAELGGFKPARLAAQWFAGERPSVNIEGDSAFAADVSWLIENLRWDIEDDLARIVGQGPAHQISRAAATLSAGFTFAVKTLQDLVVRGAGGGPR